MSFLVKIAFKCIFKQKKNEDNYLSTCPNGLKKKKKKTSARKTKVISHLNNFTVIETYGKRVPVGGKSVV